MEATQRKVLWVDLEMTGLDERAHHIVEVASLVTDWDFNVLGRFQKVIFQPPEVLSRMDAVVRQLHETSGLMTLIPHGEPLAAVETSFLQWLDGHFDKSGGGGEKLILAGNSVSNDLRFLMHHFTKLAPRLHYRIIDVSSFKEVFKQKYNQTFQKHNSHRAMEDVEASVAELKYYLSCVKLEPQDETPGTTLL
jgi:oligoribonuclease